MSNLLSFCVSLLFVQTLLTLFLCSFLTVQVGRIADRGAEFVSAKEWMRICFELLELLKAHKKAIRRAAVSTFGYIAKAIGPQDVLHTLLNNLKVQDRQMRVCTTVAIAIVAETCGPFTVLPALMNEYRVPELNIQNGVLKALSFMFEYIGKRMIPYIACLISLCHMWLTFITSQTLFQGRWVKITFMLLLLCSKML
jgi:hypothetical protein